jgi:hypothetical protein
VIDAPRRGMMHMGSEPAKLKPSLLVAVLSLACSSHAGEVSGAGTTGGASPRDPEGIAAPDGSASPPGSGGTGDNVTLMPRDPESTTEGDVDNGECAQQSFVPSSEPADVLLVLDRSKSMIEHTVPPLDQTRWDAVVAGLTSVISGTDASVAWGLKLFPEGEGSACAAESVTDAVAVAIAPHHAPAVNALIEGTQALGNGTPTGDAILQATNYLTARGARHQYLVLATDGEPSCPKGADGDAQQHAIDAITTAMTAGFPTYVIGVVDAKDNDTARRLDAMAVAGGTARSGSDHQFYAAYSQDELALALEAVTGDVASCAFTFSDPPPDPTNIAVKLDGMRLERDETRTQGWDYLDDSYSGVELYGDACAALKDTAQSQIDIVFGCKGRPIK